MIVSFNPNITASKRNNTPRIAKNNNAVAFGKPLPGHAIKAFVLNCDDQTYAAIEMGLANGHHSYDELREAITAFTKNLKQQLNPVQADNFKHLQKLFPSS